MDIHPIKTEADYEAALDQIEDLMETARPGSAEADRLDVLTTLVEAYEEKAHPIGPPDPIEAIRHALDARGLEENDFAKVIKGTRSRAWEILHRRRALTMAMIRNVHSELGVPAEVLIEPYELDEPRAG